MSRAAPTAPTATNGICPEQVSIYAPGEILAEAAGGVDRRRRIFFRDFRYGPSTVAAPGIDSLLMVVYRKGRSRMRRRCDAPWRETVVEPGAISILGARVPSFWEWDKPIEVSHIYLSDGLLAETCARAFERDYRRLSAYDALEVRDQKLCALAEALADELRTPSAGGTLLVDSLAQALAVRTIRDYHRDHGTPCGLTPSRKLTAAQERRALDFIEAHADCNFELADLARSAGVSEFHFIRCFKISFGVSPYQFVMQKRLEHAVALISTSSEPLAEIALRCGFSDQSHMTRTLKKGIGITPGAIRRNGA